MTVRARAGYTGGDVSLRINTSVEDRQILLLLTILLGNIQQRGAAICHVTLALDTHAVVQHNYPLLSIRLRGFQKTVGTVAGTLHHPHGPTDP
jgi:hypothetical protein